MLGFLAAIENSEYLEGRRTKCKTAEDLGQKHCVRCGFCCLVRPCLPSPGEVKRIAGFLNLTPKKAIGKYFVIDSFETGGTKFIFPAKSSQRDITGTYIPSDRTFDRGYCIFFDKKEKVCRIYPVRPKQARMQKCWNNNEDRSEKQKREILKKWADFDWMEFGLRMIRERISGQEST